MSGYGRRYVEEDKATYRKAARENGALVSYAGNVAEAESSEAEKEAESIPAMSHSTVYRWVTWFAKAFEGEIWRLEERAQHRGGLVDFTSFVIPPQKYRSIERRELLVTCRRILRCRPFAQKNPPDFGTGCRSP